MATAYIMVDIHGWEQGLVGCGRGPWLHFHGLFILHARAHTGNRDNCLSGSSTDTVYVRYSMPEVGYCLPSVQAIVPYGINRTCKHTYTSLTLGYTPANS